MNLNLEHTFNSRAHKLLHWGHWFTFLNIFIALLISITYLTPETIPDTAIGWAYLATSWIGHTAFLSFICFLVTIFPVSLVFPYQKHVRGISSLIATCCVLILAVDAYAFNKLGYHISSSSLDEIFILLNHSWQTHKTSATLWFLSLTVAVLVYELLISNFTWKRHSAYAQNKRFQWLAVPFLACFVVSHLLHIWADAKGNMDITKQDNLFLLSYPMTAKTLLARYDLLELHTLQTHRTNGINQHSSDIQLAFNTSNLCIDTKQPSEDVSVLILLEPLTPTEQIGFEADDFEKFSKHLQPLKHEDALFALFYGLPAFYKEKLLGKSSIPAWIQVLQKKNIRVTIDVAEPAFFQELSRIYKVIDKINANNPDESSNHITFTLFPSFPSQAALQHADNALIISLAGEQIAPLHKSNLFVKWSGPNRFRNQITTNSGISGMLLHDWFPCASLQAASMIPANIFDRDPGYPRVEFTEDTLVSLNRDKITLVATADGNTKTFSATTLKSLNNSDNSMELVQAVSLLTKLERQAYTTSHSNPKNP